MTVSKRTSPCTALLAILALLASGLVAMVAAAAPAAASHLRAGGLNWHATSPNVAEFHYSGAYRWSFFNNPPVGSVRTGIFQVTYGDGTQQSPAATVVSVDPANDVMVIDSHFSHTYANPSSSYTAAIQTCCRSSRTPTNHINNPDKLFRVETLVTLAKSQGSAASQTSPIVDCPVSGLCQFGLPATTPDTGVSLHYRFASNAEAAGGQQFVQPSGAAINSTTGVYSWDTTGAVEGGLYSTQVMIETHRAGVPVTKTAVDFFIRISSSASANQAPSFTGPTPADGTIIRGSIGTPISIPVEATDPNAGDTVTLGGILPAGATFTKTAGNPASGTITFTPTTTVDTLMTLTAIDQLGLQATQRSIRIRVADSTPPVVSGPGDTTVEATDASGAVALFSASATDDIDGPVPVSCTPDSGSIFPLGVTTVTCTATDAAGNIGTSTGTVTVRDSTGPEISVVDMVVEAVGADGAAVTFTPTASDLVDGATAVTCTPASGSTFALGTSTVSCSSADSRGNASVTSFWIVVQDTTDPVLMLPADITQEATGAAGAGVSWSASATDTVTGSIALTCSPASGSTFALGGPHAVLCSATDGSGNTADGGFSVTVVDTTPPAVTYTGPSTLEATGPSGAAAVLTGEATDLVDGSLPATCTSADGAMLALGVHEIVCTATDAAGNTGEARATVTVVDTTAPTLSVPLDAVLEAVDADGAPHAFTATGTDTVSSVGVSCSADSGDVFPLGVTTVSCMSTDSAGNSTTGSFTVTVQDTMGPVITTSGDQTVEATSPAGAPASYTAGAVDAVDGAVPVSCDPASGSTFPLGTTVALCTASDSRGNQGVPATASVTVVDTTDPTLTVPADVVAEATGPDGAAVAYGAATGADLVDTDVAVACLPAAGSLFALGTHTVTCTATDDYDNSADASFTVTVQDTTAPVVTPPAPVSQEATGPDGAAVAYGAASASDLVSGEVAVSCEPPSGSTFPVGTSAVICSATDAAGNVGTASTEMTVTDTTAPEVVAPDDMTLEATGPAGALASWPQVLANDLVDGQLDATCSPASGSTFALGAAGVTCEATDQAGNTGQGAFTVTVVDTTPPAITVPAPGATEATGPNGAAVTFSAATASDIVDGDVAPSCNAASGDTFPLGSTTVTCTATDAKGNTSTETFTVTVVDTTAPALIVPAGITAEATSPSGAGVAFEVTASDLVDGAVAPSCSSSSGDTFALGDTTITCSATDAAGNTASASFVISVVDTTPPVVTWSGNAGTYTVEQAVLITCAATDTGSGVASTTCADVNGPAHSLGLGTHTVTATATDNAGNTGTGSTTFTVTVTADSLCALTRMWVSKAGVAHALCGKIVQAESLSEKGQPGAAAELENYRNQVRSQSGKSLTAGQADLLSAFSLQLAAQL